MQVHDLLQGCDPIANRSDHAADGRNIAILGKILFCAVKLFCHSCTLALAVEELFIVIWSQVVKSAV